MFLIVFVFAIVLLTDLFEAGTNKELNQESQRILQKLSSGIGPQLIKGTEVDIESVEQLLNLTYDELKELLGVKYDFCIYFEDQDGNIILINESFVGFGDPNVTINDLPCGPGGTVCINMTDKDNDNFSGTVGCGEFDCNDNNDTIYPKDNESNDWLDAECYDGQDNDCDGFVDRFDSDCCIDVDGDGYSPIPGCSPLVDCVDNITAAMALYDPDQAPLGGWGNCPTDEDDCEHLNNTQCPICIHPLAPDPCGDNIDTNCMIATEQCLGWDFNCTAYVGACPVDMIPLFKISEMSDAHAALWDIGPYVTNVCCKSTDPDNVMLMGDGSADDFYVMSLSNETNAHVEKYNRSIKDIAGDGSDGAITSIPGPMIVDTDVKSEYNFTYIDIDLADSNNVQITGSKPLIIRAQQYITLDGAILDISGDDGEDAACAATEKNDGKGGLGRAGGGNGGDGGNQESTYCESSSGGTNAEQGYGVGRGAGGKFYDANHDCDFNQEDTDTEGGAGGSYASRGTNGDCGPRISCTTESLAGDSYNDHMLNSLYGRVPILGGSGGGGGASDYKTLAIQNGAGGGAGGGAVTLIAPEITITNSGGIYADGGDGGVASPFCTAIPNPSSAGGGAGSGGTVYIIAENVLNNGVISVEGGIGGTGTGGDGGDGGDGRIRMDLIGSSGSSSNATCAAPGVNVALGKTASQSTVFLSGGGSILGCFYRSGGGESALYAVDDLCNFIHTQNNPGEWWQVDLGEDYQIGKFELQKRDDCCANRPDTYKIQVSDTGAFAGEEIDVVVQSSSSCNTPSCVMEHTISPIEGRYVRVLNTGSGDSQYLNIQEFRVFSPDSCGSSSSGCGGTTTNPMPKWSRKKEITITGSAVDLIDYPVRLIVAYDSNMQSGFRDLRFLDASDNQLGYFIEEYTYSSATVWVNIPSIPTTGTTITMYYGNSEALSVSDVDDGGLEFFDDFSGAHVIGDYSKVDVGVSNAPSFWRLYTASNMIMQRSNIYNGNFGSALLTGSSIADFEVRIKTYESDNDLIGLIFSYQDTSSFYTYQYSNDYHGCGAAGPGAHRSIQKDQTCSNTNSLVKDASPPGRYDTVDLIVRRYGSNIDVYEDGVSILSAVDSSYGAGDIGLMTDGDQYGRFYGPFIVRKYSSPDPIASFGAEISLTESSCGEYSGNMPAVSDGTVHFGQHFFQNHHIFDIENPDDVQGINCTYVEGGCDDLLGQICVTSISSRTDAHVTACEDPLAYNNSICCTMITTCVC